ncbi:hypothetical protein [Caulobacter sp. 602-1]|uniref:hypothetical protein n=1 Tax=Caulobacter sp. 602-1 TaxID=2492472 RepID=UPI000F6324EF|nr:hypothetical protein [Caulobacter sp. 602-1]RRN65987.1 hypothetical protein EIK80_01515 [Caulobacter sp. 602-1]
MADWKVVDLPSVFERVVRSYDEHLNEIPDDGEWHRRVSESYYLLAEFLAEHGLIAADIDVSRRADLVIFHSQLTPLGQAFDKLEIDKWLTSLDRRKPGSPLSNAGLERRWRKFIKANPV